MSAALDTILPPRRQIANPFTGEVLDRDDLPALKAALSEVEEFIDKDVYGPHRAVFTMRNELRARVGELVPTPLPKYELQSAAQRELALCPRCRTPLPRVVIAETSPEGEEREPDAVGRVASPSASSTLDEGGPEVGGAPDDSAGSESPPSSSVEQTTLLPQGPRTAAQEAALGIDILGEPLAASSPAPPGEVEGDTQPSSTTPEPPEAEDPPGGSTSLFEIPPSARSEP